MVRVLITTTMGMTYLTKLIGTVGSLITARNMDLMEAQRLLRWVVTTCIYGTRGFIIILT